MVWPFASSPSSPLNPATLFSFLQPFWLPCYFSRDKHALTSGPLDLPVPATWYGLRQLSVSWAPSFPQAFIWLLPVSKILFPTTASEGSPEKRHLPIRNLFTFGVIAILHYDTHWAWNLTAMWEPKCFLVWSVLCSQPPPRIVHSTKWVLQNCYWINAMSC